MIGRLGYSGFIASGGSSGPPGSETLQDVIINGSLLNRNNTINGGGFDLNFTNNLDVNVETSVFQVGDYNGVSHLNTYYLSGQGHQFYNNGQENLSLDVNGNFAFKNILNAHDTFTIDQVGQLNLWADNYGDGSVVGRTFRITETGGATFYSINEAQDTYLQRFNIDQGTDILAVTLSNSFLVIDHTPNTLSTDFTALGRDNTTGEVGLISGGGGNTIYTGNGDITDNRVVSGNDYAYSLTLQNFSNYLVSIGALGFSMGASGGYYLTNDLTELLEAGTSLAVTNSSIDITNIGNDGGNLTVANKVGIGTSTPTEALDVVGNGLFTGNVGIGTATPTEVLEVSNGNIRISDDNYLLSQSGNLIGNTVDGTVLGIGSNYLTIGYSGNVGINTSTPTVALDVVGNGLFTGDVEVSTIGSGFILQSPDATRWRIEVSNLGVLTASAV